LEGEKLHPTHAILAILATPWPRRLHRGRLGFYKSMINNLKVAPGLGVVPTTQNRVSSEVWVRVPPLVQNKPFK
jgi:hypothetical protein